MFASCPVICMAAWSFLSKGLSVLPGVPEGEGEQWAALRAGTASIAALCNSVRSCQQFHVVSLVCYSLASC